MLGTNLSEQFSIKPEGVIFSVQAAHKAPSKGNQDNMGWSKPTWRSRCCQMKLSVHILDLLALRSHSFPARLTLQRIESPEGSIFSETERARWVWRAVQPCKPQGRS